MSLLQQIARSLGFLARAGGKAATALHAGLFKVAFILCHLRELGTQISAQPFRYQVIIWLVFLGALYRFGEWALQK